MCTAYSNHYHSSNSFPGASIANLIMVTTGPVSFLLQYTFDWSLARTYERAERDVYDAHPVWLLQLLVESFFSYSHTYDAYARMQRVLHSCCCARILLNIRSAFDRDATRSSIEVADIE